jgi:hypothetical protein
MLRESTASLFDGNALMKLCFDQKMRCFDGESGSEMIKAKRQTRLKQVEQEAAEMAQRRALAAVKREERAAAVAAAAAAEADTQKATGAAEPGSEPEREPEREPEPEPEPAQAREQEQEQEQEPLQEPESVNR